MLEIVNLLRQLLNQINSLELIFNCSFIIFAYKKGTSIPAIYSVNSLHITRLG